MDDLEADIRAAVEGTAPSPAAEGVAPASIPSEPIAAAPAPEPAKVDDRPRDETGKFAPKADAPKLEAPKAEAAPAVPAAAPVATQPVAATPAAQPIPAPTNWKGAGKVQWDKLPEPVRKEISEDYTRFSQTQARLEKLDAALGNGRAEVLAATYGSVEQGIQNLFAISDMATKNPQGFVLWFCQQRGLNPAQMFGQPQESGEQPTQQAPEPIMQRLGQLETMLTNMTQQQQQGAQAPVLAEIERFAADPAHPYFNDVRDEMHALLAAGRVKGGSPSERLQNAYDMAVWAHPDIRSTLIDGQVQQRTSQQANAAQQAINASVSVSGSPSGAKTASEEPDETLEQTIRRAQRAAGG